MTSTTGIRYTTPVIKKDQADDTYKFQPLPVPSGKYPYRLSLAEILPAVSDQQMVFHMVGDTGSIRNPDFQKLVAGSMSKQYEDGPDLGRPRFLYHLGDVVYTYGEADQYYAQFFGPYAQYPGPIMAIAGNHDSDINPDSILPYASLQAFTTVFCDTNPRTVSFGQNAERKSMIQPNIYWTLKTPLATIIGLHSNVPRYGVITNEQRIWFIEELKAANLERPEKAIIICMHHAPYSADINHGSSLPMIEFLNGVFAETGIRPDIIFSGHVHNYQRFSTRYADGINIPYIVAGAGGYDELHPVALKDDKRFTGNSPLFDGVKLEHYCDSKHGFLKIALERNSKGLILTGEYFTTPDEEIKNNDPGSVLEDRFVLSIV